MPRPISAAPPPMAGEHGELRTLTSNIVANHTSNNTVPSTDLPGLIEAVFHTLSGLGAAATELEQKPAVSINKSVTDKFIVCLECGKKQKMIKQHLRNAHDTNPVEYRAKWGPAHHYLMVAPVYAAEG